MTSNASPGTRILGSLRSADGAGVSESKTATRPTSTTSGRRSPIPSAWPAGTARSRAISTPADSSASTSKPMTSTAPAASTRANHRGGS
jgi:hypothetical protein